MGQGSETTKPAEATLGGEATVGGEVTLAGDAGASRTLVVPRAPATGDVIGRYVVLDTLGRGGMGVVLAAYDPQLDRKVALKLVRPDRAADRGEIEREARMIAKLRHPNLVTVHDVGTTDAGVFLAMEFIDGVTLREWQRESRSWRELVDAYVQAARGLAAAHEGGVVHGDFKPENVFVGALGGKIDVKLLDFGLAHAAGHEPELPTGSPSSWIPAGTLAYMSPERLHGAAATPAGDQFAFCVALFEALTGSKPYDLETLASSSPHVATKATPAWRSHVAAPQWLRAVALRGLALDPSVRHASMHDVARALERGPGRERRRVYALGGVAVLAAGAVLAVTRPDPCADADVEVRRAWSADLVADASRSGDGSIDAGLLERVDRQAIEYVEELSAAARRGCMMTRTGDLLLEARRTRCIDMGLTTLHVWSEVLRGEDIEARRSVLVDAVGWEAPMPCDDDAALLHEPEPPPDLERARALDVMLRLTRAALSRYAVSFAASEAELDGLVAELRELGDPALLAEALYRRGQIAIRGGMPDDAYELLLSALSSAEAAGATRLQVQIWKSIAESRNAIAGADNLQALAIERAAAGTARLGDPPDLVAIVHLARAALANRRGEYPEADAELQRTIDVAETAGLARAAISARLSRVIVQLRSNRIDLAVATGERVASDAEQFFGRDHPETAMALGARSAAFVAGGRFDEARTSVTRSLAILNSWGRFGVTAGNGITCNWCHGVARLCRRSDALTACGECVERILRTENPTLQSVVALGVGLNWLRLLAPETTVDRARRALAMADTSEEWTRIRSLAVLTLFPADPKRALEVAKDLCPTPSAESCYDGANMLVALHDPDAHRRRDALDEAIERWRTATTSTQSDTLDVGLALARAGYVTPDALARAAAAATEPCDPDRDAALAWIAAQTTVPAAK